MEIITGVERRRRWRAEEKLRIVAELEQPGACFAEVARRHEVSRGLLWNWRRQVRSGTLEVARRPTISAGAGDVRAPRPEPAPASGPSSSRRQQAVATPRSRSRLPDGTPLRVGRDVSATGLRRVLAALRG